MNDMNCKQSLFCLLFIAGVEAVPDVKCVSFDGDADRIVYFYVDKGDSIWPFIASKMYRGAK